MADTGPRGPQGPAGTSIDLPVAIANGGTGATTASEARNALEVESLTYRTDIENNADLNSITSAGSYRCRSNAIAATLTNCPASAAFIMTVGFATGQAAYLYQRIVQHDNGTVFYRSYDASGNHWGTWYKFEGVAVP